MRLEESSWERLEDDDADGVEDRQTEVADEVDGGPELEGGVDAKEPEGHAQVGEPLESEKSRMR